MCGREAQEGLRREGRSELNGYRNTPSTGEILSVWNLYCVNPPARPPAPPFFLSLVCNIELFSKRMNISCMVFFFFLCLFPPPFFFFFLYFIFFLVDGEEWSNIRRWGDRLVLYFSPSTPHYFNFGGNSSLPHKILKHINLLNCCLMFFFFCFCFFIFMSF